jgi:peptidoglycan/xylan/chitin deacetylase (PgdA/CDA1 family)
MTKHRSTLRLLLISGVLAGLFALGGALGAFGAAKPTLSFTTATQSSAAGQSSATITVSLSAGASGPATVKLSSSASTGTFRNQADTATVTSVVIAAGQTQASFRYRDTIAGTPTIAAVAASDASPKQWTGNLSGTQTETVTAAALDHLTLAPASATVASGHAQSYTATGFDAYGNSLGNVTAQTTFSIAPDGSCQSSSCQALLVGAHTVSASNGAAGGKASLTVSAGPLDHLVVSPASAQIIAGQSQAYKAEGFDSAGNDLGNLTAQTTFTVSPNGSCQAALCQAQTAGTHTVNAVDAAATGQASLTVSAGSLAQIAITPKTAQIKSGQSQIYSATGYDQFGNSLGDVTAQTTFSITPDGSCQGASCQAATAGEHTVSASDAGLGDQAKLAVAPGPLARLEISPKTASTTAGEAQTYKAEGFDAAGNDLGDLTEQTSFAIAPDGSCQGASCSVTSAGPHAVSASDGGFGDSAQLAVNAGPFDHLLIAPKTALILAGESQAYSAEGFDQFGNDLGDVSSSSTFAIAPSGSCAGALCSAGDSGPHTVTASKDSSSDQAQLSVQAEAPSSIVISPKSAGITAGETQSYEVEAFGATGNDLGDVTAQTSFSISPDGSCQGASCEATIPGQHTVSATLGGLEDQAALSVLSGPLDHLVLAPETATITAGESQTYKAEGFDAVGNDLGDMTAQASFSIDPNGSCEGASCTATVAGPHTVSASVEGATGAAQLAVSPAPFDYLTIAPKTASITAGQSQLYSAEGFDKYGNDLGDVSATTSFSITPDGDCAQSECSAGAAAQHTVIASRDGASDEAQLGVQAGPTSRIAISPQVPSITAGDSQSFAVEAFDQSGNDLGDVTAQTTFSITPDGSCQEATCTALKAGPHTVTASEGGLLDETTLQVNPGALARISVSPPSAQVSAGEAQTYKVEGYDQYGNDLGDVTAQASFSIAPNGSCNAASCSAGPSGPHTVSASDDAFADTASLSVVPGVLDHLAVWPETATITAGELQTYKAEGFDAAGNDLGDLTAQTEFSIAPNGSCQAASCGATSAGSHTVKAADGGAGGQATLQVHSPLTTVSLTFDDGVADQTEAGRIMAEHSLAGTFYIISGRVGASGYLGRSDLSTLAANGNEIGAHTVNHLNLLNLSPEEAERQVCNGRVQLENWGFHVWDFAYPQGGTNPQLEQIVRNCNLNSARIVSNIVSPGTCFGCAYAETIPPGDPYAIITPDSIKTANTLQDLKNYVIQAQEHGGGWVPLVFHHLCNGCDPESVSAQTFSAFLDWLASEGVNGVSVKTVHEVIGGEEKPPVTGPAAPPPSGDLVQNPSLEADQNANGVPDCWTVAGSGTNSWSAAMSTDANSGNFAEGVSISDFTSGDRRLITTQDLGQCAPPANVGDTYTASAYLKGQGTAKWVVYYRDSQGAWNYWTQSAAINLGSTYALASWKTPQVPSGATALSIGISLRSVGAFSADDFFLKDNGAGDQIAPSVSLSSPAAGSTVGGTATYISANATDNVGVASVKFYLDGTLLGSKAAPTVSGGSTYQWKWDTTATSEGPHALTAIASDAAGNQTTTAALNVTVAQDSTPPVTAILCNGSSTCAGVWFKAPLSVSLKASDNVAVAHTYYTTDGSEPSATNGSLYSGAFSVSQSATVRYRSVDTIGNWEAVQSQALQIDGQPPSAQITAPSEGQSLLGSVYINANGGDDVGVASVKFLLDGVSLGSKTAPTVSGGSSYQWKWDTATASEGAHILTTITTDLAGNQTTSAPVSVNVQHDSTPPTTAILCNGSSTCASWYRAPVSITLKASDNLAVAATYYTTDGSEPSATNGSLYTGAFSVPQSATVKYRSVDTAGNWEAVQTQLLQIDPEAPTVAISAPAPGATVSGNAVYINASATDNVGVASVKFLLDGAVLGSKTAPTVSGGSTYQWKWDSTTASVGQHTLTTVATDPAGNQTTSAAVTVTVLQDTTPPVTTILCNASSCATWYRAPVSITLKASDNLAVAATYYTTDGSEPSATNGSLYTGAFSVPQSATVKYRSVDTAGNWEQVRSQLLQIDSQAPSAQISAPASGATVSGSAVYITAQATDDVSVASVRFYLDGVSLGSKTAPTVSGGSTYQWKWDSTTASKGAHTLSVVATDQAGNQTSSASVPVTVG